MTSAVPALDAAAAVLRIQRLMDSGARVMVGITGPPGCGKSTLGAQLAAAVGELAVLVPMDGYHLAQRELGRLGLSDRKGAAGTFDGSGYLALLQRLRTSTDAVVYAPYFDRQLEEPIAGAIAVPANARLIVTEGNYLLLEDPPWSGVREVLTETWYVDVDDALRRTRLIARHREFGRSAVAAAEWVRRVDDPNAALVAAARHRADVAVVI